MPGLLIKFVRRRRPTMLGRLIISKLTILAIVLTSLQVLQAQTLITPDRGEGRRHIPMRISSYEDDPFVLESIVQLMDPFRFSPGADGRPILSNSLVRIEGEDFIYRKDTATGEFTKFAWNPWPQAT